MTMPIGNSVVLGKDVRIFHPELVNIFGCTIGDGTTIGPFVEIQANVTVGASCKISSHSFLCSGVQLADEVFIGHGVMFTNDRFPRATSADGRLKGAGDWVCESTKVGRRAAIGSGATILPGVEIGANAIVGAGSVVTRDVPANTVVAGNPAQVVGPVPDRQEDDQ